MQTEAERLRDLAEEAPKLEQAMWDDVVPGADAELSEDVDLDILDEQGHGEDSLEEDDDNLYQDSDAALPEDAEERAIRRDQARQEDE